MHDCYLQLENLLPSGSHKYRLALAHINYAKKLGYNKITVGSCGNYARSMIYLCEQYNFFIDIFVPKNSYLLDNLNKKYSKLSIYYSDDYESSVEDSMNYATLHTDYYDANGFGKYQYISYKAYDNLCESLMNAIDLNNFCLWIPIGNGIMLTSIYRYFSCYDLDIKYGIVSSLNNSSPLKSMIAKRPVDIDKNTIKISKDNQPLINYKTVINTNELIKISNNNLIVEVADQDIILAHKILSKHTLCNTYGCAAMAGYMKLKNETDTIKMNHLIFITA